MSARRGFTRGLWIALGTACLVLGTVGVVLPILPTVPFYMATVLCFAKGSERLHDWFVGTRLCERHLDGFVRGRGMTMADKLRVVGTVTLVMASASRSWAGSRLVARSSRSSGSATCSTSSCASPRFRRARRSSARRAPRTLPAPGRSTPAGPRPTRPCRPT
jgi:uncharacterized membrane protein YbaN (DUF454 family)